MKDTVLQVFSDGHEIRKDSRPTSSQMIVKHPQRCPTARRGNLQQDWAKFTYFTSEEGFQDELRRCHLTLSVSRSMQSCLTATR